ncbi:hypothetical protein L218DRAFT_1010067 [Marasmius fiardii PR-910]|nr:hypothetical protein L218DRAFT_1010067 [Marasmius fiardii PR-910]
MSAQFHVDCPVAEFASFYTKLQLLLANFLAQLRGPCKSMLEHFLIHQCYFGEGLRIRVESPSFAGLRLVNRLYAQLLSYTCSSFHIPGEPLVVEKEIMMASKVRVLDANCSVADIAKIFYPSLNGGESTEGHGEVPPTMGPVPGDTSLPTTCSRAAKGKGKAATLTPPPSTSQKSARKPCILESEDDELDQLNN